MGASAKRKKEKKKDFQKPKLRVGKAKPKADNYTDTSFKAKSISLKKQSVSENAPEARVKISHHVSLLRNPTPSQRQASLAYLTNLPASDLGDAASDLLPKLPPLIHDGSAAVRSQLLKLLKKYPEQSLLSQLEQLLLWTRAGLTHLSTDIQMFATDVLEWLLSMAGEELFTLPGAWIGLLKSFISVFGWQDSSESVSRGWTAQKKQPARPGSETKILAKRLTSLTMLVAAGLKQPSGVQDADLVFPTTAYSMPQRPNAFAHLNLFGAPTEEEDQIFDNREDRQRVFHFRFEQSLRSGAAQAIKDGGEIGRASSSLQKQIETTMSDYDT